MSVSAPCPREAKAGRRALHIAPGASFPVCRPPHEGTKTGRLFVFTWFLFLYSTIASTQEKEGREVGGGGRGSGGERRRRGDQRWRAGGAAAVSIWRSDLEVLSIRNGGAAEEIRRSTPDFQDLPEAKAFRLSAKISPVPPPRCSGCLELLQTGNQATAATPPARHL